MFRKYLNIIALIAILLGGVAVLAYSPPASEDAEEADTVETVAQTGGEAEETGEADEAATEEAEESADGEALGGTVWDGIFTEEQQQRGEAAYLASCAACHNTNLRGSPGGPGIAGGRFSFNWNDRPVGELLAYIQQNMPIGQAGSLSAGTYADILSHILHENGYPAGDSELPGDPALLQDVLITRGAD